MSKVRTHKATAKRFTVSKHRKFVARRAGQDHFNARESGRTTVRKRRDRVTNAANRKQIERLVPYFRTRIKKS